ncbi:uncharacterized protein LOC122076913 isoform X2 [Macadamia integrifolia]|uniref:uncharacterized protein LOC122076913 isoform X2 n=1 Tax=Macadamia integrifolia TaxID=60698 RepID=UPI001C4EDB31|nr:uncharacterized protein LOC122076913 isoform X2 [Macadamia integrifolia]XP_042498493.1 uncharacterized protein LOC122076913 isoform X2 [Macadamia integrifolia]
MEIKFKLSIFLFFFLVLWVFSSDFVYGTSECTNSPTQLSSHTYRFELLSSNNETWRKEMFKDYYPITANDSAWIANFNSQKSLNKIKKQSDKYTKHQDPGSFLREVSLHDVRLDPNSLHGRAQLTNLEYLLMLEVDSLVWSFRKTAGLPTPGTHYGGWEAPTVELRGHFLGHYLSASAQMWASTNNGTLLQKMSAVVSALDACQQKMGSGYLSAFPSEMFDRLEARKKVWAPYYTIHKILAGLLDQYMLAGNKQALKMVEWMVEYFFNRVLNVIARYSVERHWRTLNEETGGMNDILYKLYNITGDQNHLVLVHLFDKPCFLGLLAVKSRTISGFHANTHIPIIIGSQMRYETTGDPLYKEIGTYFLDVVNSSHSYATGGTSFNEFWTDPERLADTLKADNEESCTTYNMLKVSRHLFRWTKEMKYADYYERALTNGVLSIQRGTEPGIMIYFLPLGRGGSKARSTHGWGTKFNTFWCCYGTGIESFSKLGDSIYFEEEGKLPALYVIQFISSNLDWKSGQIVLNQTVEPVVSWDPYLRLKMTFFTKKEAGQSSILNLRIPLWTYSNGAKAALNSQNLNLPQPGNFLSVTRQWHGGDELTLQLPIVLRTEAIQDDRPEYASLQAILYGPYLLAGLSSGDGDIKTGTAHSVSDWITAIPKGYSSQLISISQVVSNATFFITNSNNSITMEKLPEPGTDFAVHATFRLIVSQDMNSSHFSSLRDAIGKSVLLEPFDLPGMLVVQKGPNDNLALASATNDKGMFTFKVVAGLDGKNNSVSLESESHHGCFVYSGLNYNAGTSVKLSCKSGTTDAGFQNAASFNLNSGISEYHPISFVAKGAKRNFLLMPLLSLRDESYTVYFNIGA